MQLLKEITHPTRRARTGTDAHPGVYLVLGAPGMLGVVADEVVGAEVKPGRAVELYRAGIVANVKDIAVVGVVKEGSGVALLDRGAPATWWSERLVTAARGFRPLRTLHCIRIRCWGMRQRAR